MPAYHSSYLNQSCQTVSNFAILPISKSVSPNIADIKDIIDEALYYFRPNVFFRNFDIRGPADRTLVYLLLFISDCLSKISPKATLAESHKAILGNLTSQPFSLPGEPGFPLNAIFPAPSNRAEADQLRQYLSSLRSELANRLLAILYEKNKDLPDKWWMSFQKKKFMNKSL